MRGIKPTAIEPNNRFYLMDDRNDFLHMSGQKMTNYRGDAWIGTERQLLGMRKASRIARDLRDIPARAFGGSQVEQSA